MRWGVLGCVAAVGAAGLTACEPAPPPRWDVDLLSVDTAGQSTASADSPVVSPDGTKVAFRSHASTYGPTDTNGELDIYIRDLATGEIELVSVNAAGDAAADGVSDSAPIFASDTRVVFTSSAPDIVSGDTNGMRDVFVRDLVAGTTTLVTVGAGGTRPADRGGYFAVVSPDGTKVAFVSDSTDLVADYDGHAGGAYLRDLEAGTTTLLTRDNDGNPGHRGAVGAFTPDSTGVVMVSDAPLAGPEAPTHGDAIFLRDLATGTNTLVSATASGDSGWGLSGSPVVSPDGSKVAFVSTVDEFGPTDTNDDFDVYVADLATGAISLVSANAEGTDSGDRRSGTLTLPTFSPDGHSLAFTSHASDLGPVDTHATPDVYLRDLDAGTTTLVSSNAEGSDSGSDRSGAWSSLAFDPAGTRLAFVSSAGDLGPRDTNRMPDVYVRDLRSGAHTLLSTNAAGTNSGDLDSGYMSPVAFTPDGTGVVFESRAVDLHPDQTLHRGNVFLATAPLAADATMSLSAPSVVAPGAEVAYRVTVGNGGPDAAAGATLVVALPAGTTFAGVTTTTGTCAQTQVGVVACDLGTLPDGATVEVTVTAKVDAAAGTTLVGHAALAADTWNPAGSPVVSSATTTVEG